MILQNSALYRLKVESGVVNGKRDAVIVKSVVTFQYASYWS